jgi:hypothetical protein
MTAAGMFSSTSTSAHREHDLKLNRNPRRCPARGQVSRPVRVRNRASAGTSVDLVARVAGHQFSLRGENDPRGFALLPFCPGAGRWVARRLANSLSVRSRRSGTADLFGSSVTTCTREPPLDGWVHALHLGPVRFGLKVASGTQRLESVGSVIGFLRR